MTPWIAVTLVSRSSTSAPIETFMTLASTVIRNCASARSISTPVPPPFSVVARMPPPPGRLEATLGGPPGGPPRAPGVHPGEGAPSAPGRGRAWCHGPDRYRCERSGFGLEPVGRHLDQLRVLLLDRCPGDLHPGGRRHLP